MCCVIVFKTEFEKKHFSTGSTNPMLQDSVCNLFGSYVVKQIQIQFDLFELFLVW